MGISSGLGNALVPTSYGFRNEIINGNFMINQRAYASGTNLASGAYGFDRWKSNFTNTALTFTSAPQGQTVTISASGVVRQIVERANVVAGSYVLSWFGTATGRVYNDGATPPSYQSGPLSVVLDGTANVIVEFTPASGTATLGNVQLEFGSRATPFEQRPIGVELNLCLRYFWRHTSRTNDGAIGAGVIYSSTAALGTIVFPVPTRTTSPTVTGSSNSSQEAVVAGAVLGASGVGFGDATNYSVNVGITISGATAGQGAFIRFAGAGDYFQVSDEL
jgi:hypothetical protein